MLPQRRPVGARALFRRDFVISGAVNNGRNERPQAKEELRRASSTETKVAEGKKAKAVIADVKASLKAGVQNLSPSRRDKLRTGGGRARCSRWSRNMTSAGGHQRSCRGFLGGRRAKGWQHAGLRCKDWTHVRKLIAKLARRPGGNIFNADASRATACRSLDVTAGEGGFKARVVALRGNTGRLWVSMAIDDKGRLLPFAAPRLCRNRASGPERLGRLSA